MQTTGTSLHVVERRSLVRLLMVAQDCRSAHGLLYQAAVRDDGRARTPSRSHQGDGSRLCRARFPDEGLAALHPGSQTMSLQISLILPP